MSQTLFCVVAVAANGTIGAGGTMPWHLPADLRHFKAMTLGKVMVMGRKTFASLPRLLPGRRHIVLTRDPHWSAPGAEVVRDLDAALALAGDGDVAMIGGAEIFALALPRASRIELTEIHADIAGDTVMPPLGDGWRETAREEHAAVDERPGFAFVTLLRDI